MDVLVINGSPKKSRGNTATISSYFIDGMKEEGASVETIYAKEYDIGDCKGCFNCWGNTPGACIQKDDMAGILDKIAKADILILATPVYVDGMTGSLKTLLDRTIPLLHGRFELRDDHCRHPLRKHVKQGKVVLISVSGFTELDNFDPLVVHIKSICKNLNREFVGSILRPVAWVMDGAEKQGVQLDDIYDALKQAGRELITDGKMKDDTLKIIRREMVPREIILELMSGFYQDK
jgi:multimeric flavodoxin WrbA